MKYKDKIKPVEGLIKWVDKFFYHNKYSQSLKWQINYHIFKSGYWGLILKRNNHNPDVTYFKSSIQELMGKNGRNLLGEWDRPKPTQDVKRWTKFHNLIN